MRHALFLLSAAFVCGHVSSANGQFTFTATSPTPAPQLYLAQTESANPASELAEQTQDLFGDQAKSSPFDFMSESQAVEPSSLTPATESEQATADPVASHPVGLHHRPNLPQSVGSAIPVNYMPPIDWNSQYRRTPNPTASYMMQQWCSDGLWDNYQAERAAQCAKQYARIYQSHGHCNHCVMPGCSTGQCRPTHQPGCHTGACNRGASGCGASQSCATPTAPCETDCALAAPPTPNGRPIPASTTQPATDSDGKVAFFPQLFNR